MFCKVIRFLLNLDRGIESKECIKLQFFNDKVNPKSLHFANAYNK